MTGNRDDAFEVYMFTHGYGSARTIDIEVIGRGESRTVYLLNGVAYKSGRDSANVYEHEALTAWRKAGAWWAPKTSLYEFATPYGDETETIVAMTYLPDDGNIDEATEAEIRKVAPQTCRENLHSCGGQTWLIDGVDIERMPS
jgi:hypothetical protein